MKQTAFGQEKYPIVGNVTVEGSLDIQGGTPEEPDVNFRLVRM